MTSDWDRLFAAEPDPEFDQEPERPPRDRNPHLVPWLVVAGVVVVALVVSIVVVLGLRGGGTPAADASDAPAPAQTSVSPSAGPSASTPASPRPTATPTPTPTIDPDDPERGPTIALDISQWGVTADLDQRLGRTSYTIDADQVLTMETELAATLPDSCAAARAGWGIQQVPSAQPGSRSIAGKNYIRVAPDGCSAAPQLFAEIDAFQRWAFESLHATAS